MRFIRLLWITTRPGRAWVGSVSNKHNPSTKSGLDACISSRITTVIQVVSDHQINYNCFNEPFAVSPYRSLYWDMHGLIFETSIWLLAGSTRFLSSHRVVALKRQQRARSIALCLVLKPEGNESCENHSWKVVKRQQAGHKTEVCACDWVNKLCRVTRQKWHNGTWPMMDLWRQQSPRAWILPILLFEPRIHTHNSHHLEFVWITDISW